MNKLHIAIICGTTRPSRKSIHVANLVQSIGSKLDEIEVELVDPLDFNLPYDGNQDETRDPKLTKIFEKADGFFIVVPEYNHSFSGSLKRMLDSEFDAYKHKPAVLAGVSNGQWGGVRAIETLIPVLKALSIVVVNQDVQLGNINELFSEDGELQDDTYIKRVERSYKELIWMGKTLKWGRENY